MRPAAANNAAKKPKKSAVNVSVRQDLLKDARAASINLSETLETALQDKLRKHQEQAWLRENAKALQQYADFVNRVGVISDLIQRPDSEA